MSLFQNQAEVGLNTNEFMGLSNSKRIGRTIGVEFWGMQENALGTQI